MSFFKKYLHGIQRMKREAYGTTLMSLALFLFLSATLVYAWTAPTGTPPSENSAGPLDVGSVNQLKNGTLGTGGLLVQGDTSLQDKTQITGGNPGLGKVLVSDASGNASWMDYVQARKNADRLRCPDGSSKISLNGRTFCGYWKSIPQMTVYCDPFGQTHDPLVACYDTGIGQNHGVQPFANGCTAWEGDRNYGAGAGKMYCEKLAYYPHSASDCTAKGAVLGTIKDGTLSLDPIVTCNIPTPYSYMGCTSGFPYAGGCWKPNGFYALGAWFPALTAADLIQGVNNVCMPGWINYIGNCI